MDASLRLALALEPLYGMTRQVCQWLGQCVCPSLLTFQLFNFHSIPSCFVFHYPDFCKKVEVGIASLHFIATLGLLNYDWRSVLHLQTQKPCQRTNQLTPLKQTHTNKTYSPFPDSSPLYICHVFPSSSGAIAPHCLSIGCQILPATLCKRSISSQAIRPLRRNTIFHQ